MKLYLFPGAKFITFLLLVVPPAVNSMTGSCGASKARTSSSYDCGVV